MNQGTFFSVGKFNRKFERLRSLNNVGYGTLERRDCGAPD